MPSITTNDGVKLAYELHGSSGPVIVLIHGWSASQNYFVHQISELSRSCRVLVYDQRFHGESDKPNHGFHIARLAMDLHELLSALELTDTTVVGTSMGCAVIWNYVELFASSRLSKAVFVDQAPLQNKRQDWQLGSRTCYDEATLLVLQEALTSDMTAFAAGSVDFCATLPIDSEVAEVLTQDTMKCSPDHLGHLMGDHTQLDWRPICARMTIPCLNFIGCTSTIFPTAGCEAVTTLTPDCKTVYFKEANHWLYLEEPTKFNEQLLKFVNGEETAAATYV